MKAVVQTRYGPPEVLAVREIAEPVCAKDEVLVRVGAASVADDDWLLVRGLPYATRAVVGLRKPRRLVPGMDFAGRVEAVGPTARDFRPGDAVFGWCAGAFAELVAVSERNVALKPSCISVAQAAALPTAGLTALQALEAGRVRRGQSVLINGAAGGVGTLSVQIAKAFGLTVAAVCSTRNVELLHSLGADEIVDYTKDDFTRRDRRFDLVIDLVGNRELSDLRRAVRPDGTLVLVGRTGGRWFNGTDRSILAKLLTPFIRQTLRPLVHRKRREDLVALRDLIELGCVAPLIDRTFDLHEVRDAVRYVARKRTRGRVVITIEDLVG